MRLQTAKWRWNKCIHFTTASGWPPTRSHYSPKPLSYLSRRPNWASRSPSAGLIVMMDALGMQRLTRTFTLPRFWAACALFVVVAFAWITKWRSTAASAGADFGWGTVVNASESWPVASAIATLRGPP